MYDIGGRVTQLGEERKTEGSSRDVVIVKSLTKYGLEEKRLAVVVAKVGLLLKQLVFVC